MIIRCLKMISEDYLLDIPLQIKLYHLYAADKAGNKRQGYPEMDLGEKVGDTKIRKFYLEDISRTLTMISKEINLENKYGFEKKPQEDCICCRLFQKIRS